MKFLILLPLMLAAACAETEDEFIENVKSTFLKAGKECKAKTDATDADIQTIKAYEVPETESGKCFLACFYKEIKVLKDDATIDMDLINKFLAEVKEINPDVGAKIQAAADTCFAEVKQGGDPCQVAHDGFACYQREKKARGIPSLDLN